MSRHSYRRSAEIKALYARLSGRDLSGLDYYVAFAYFKIGVILQQIYYPSRWDRRPTSVFSGTGRWRRA